LWQVCGACVEIVGVCVVRASRCVSRVEAGVAGASVSIVGGCVQKFGGWLVDVGGRWSRTGVARVGSSGVRTSRIGGRIRVEFEEDKCRRTTGGLGPDIVPLKKPAGGSRVKPVSSKPIRVCSETTGIIVKIGTIL